MIIAPPYLFLFLALAPLESAAAAAFKPWASLRKFVKAHPVERQRDVSTVTGVNVRGSKVLPIEVVKAAFERSALSGKPYCREAAQQICDDITAWYRSNGYICHEVAEASPPVAGQLRVGTVARGIVARIVLIFLLPPQVAVAEPIVASPPVEIFAVKKRQVGNATQKGNATAVPGLVRVPALTKPATVALALGLKPGQPFRWNPANLERLQKSGLFT